MDRRNFLKLTTYSAAACSINCDCNAEVMEASLPPEELYAKYVPAEKNLSFDWLASLSERGHSLDDSISYSNQETDLEIIGMTVGGIGCGTVYLSGDGRLWVWDIFNQHHEGVVPNNKAKAPEGLQTIENRDPKERDGANFLLPPRASDHRNGVEQFFEIHDGEETRSLDSSGWANIKYKGRWPIANIRYNDHDSPVSVSLESYTPFIPLNLKDSSLPATIMEYTVTNNDSTTRTIKVAGYLDNPLGQFSGLQEFRGTRSIRDKKFKGIHHVISDERSNQTEHSNLLDYGSLSLVLIGGNHDKVSCDEKSVATQADLKAGESITFRFLITWHIPNLNPAISKTRRQRHYTRQFSDSLKVAEYVVDNFESLSGLTKTWVKTWNDSTLPQWLLDRTILTANTLQTQNALILDDGQFWAWEGIGCCGGTCGHVWMYSQGHARLFPELERNLREVTDFAIAQNDDGSIQFRGTNRMSAIDSQCGYVLRTLRDLQLSDDATYLKRVWPACRKAIEYLINFDRQDPNGGLDGLLDGKQHNTLDAEWYGKVHVLCSLYLAALRAGEELAIKADEEPFANQCREVYELGKKNISELFNGEFYEQIEDPEHADAIGVGKGCYIDQVMGQFWANQLGLGRLYAAEDQKSALRSLWKYNFTPHYGNFRTAFTEGRHYALGNDSGLLMCTWPKGGLRSDFKKHWQYAYFNECMTGFEYQVAAHMVAERDADLVEKGLAITRAIHDRYSAKRGRNPYNEIECSDHYARAGSSYAVFLALCGFEYDQSKGRLAFDPVIQKEDFKAAFTTSQAWGTYEQHRKKATLKIVHGDLQLDELSLGFARNHQTTIELNDHAVELPGLTLSRGDVLAVRLHLPSKIEKT